jgi:hypothetical protein
MRIAILLFLFLTISSLGSGQSEERYKIIVTEKLDPASNYSESSKTLNLLPFDQPNAEKSVLLFDAKSGRTWILTKHTSLLETRPESGEKWDHCTLAWQPILYIPMQKTYRAHEINELEQGSLSEYPIPAQSKRGQGSEK